MDISIPDLFTLLRLIRTDKSNYKTCNLLRLNNIRNYSQIVIEFIMYYKRTDLLQTIIRDEEILKTNTQLVTDIELYMDWYIIHNIIKSDDIINFKLYFEFMNFNIDSKWYPLDKYILWIIHYGAVEIFKYYLTTHHYGNDKIVFSTLLNNVFELYFSNSNNLQHTLNHKIITTLQKMNWYKSTQKIEMILI